VVFLAASGSCYKDCGKLVLRGARSGADLRDVDVGGGRTSTHVAESAKYLGSLVHRGGPDRPDVLAHIRSAKDTFGCLRRCLFSRRDVTYEGKRKVYEGLVLAILLCSSECWCLRESEVQELRHDGPSPPHRAPPPPGRCGALRRSRQAEKKMQGQLQDARQWV
jgi:hypothetical protein